MLISVLAAEMKKMFVALLQTKLMLLLLSECHHIIFYCLLQLVEYGVDKYTYKCLVCTVTVIVVAFMQTFSMRVVFI